MSHRLALLATAAMILSGGPVLADPNCFGPSCRMTPQALMPQVQDPPRLKLDAMTMDATGKLVDVTPPPIAEPASKPTIEATAPATALERSSNQAASKPGARPDAAGSPVVATSHPDARAGSAAKPVEGSAHVAEPSVPSSAGEVVPSRLQRALPSPSANPEGLSPARPSPSSIAEMAADANRRAASSPSRPAVQGRTQAIPPRTEPTRTEPTQPVAPVARSAEMEPRPPVAPAARRQEPAPRSAGDVGRDRATDPRPVRVVTRGPDTSTYRAPSVAPPVHVEGRIVVVAHPDAYDNRWRRCQVGSDGRPLRCTPANYHPYGSDGYRPNGSYRAYAPKPGYVQIAPDPRIISIVRGD